jgi:hypothetical protein
MHQCLIRRGMAKLLFIFMATLLMNCSYQNSKSNEIDYRGEKIKLSKSYPDFDSYKNDPDNIDASETMRVQRLVMEAPIGSHFKSLVDASKAITEIAFPGYGSGGFQQQPQPNGSVLMGFSVEIPRAEKDRCFAFRGVNGEYRLIDDFIAPEFPSIDRVNEENGVLVYSTAEGQKVLTRPLPK